MRNFLLLVSISLIACSSKKEQNQSENKTSNQSSAMVEDIAQKGQQLFQEKGCSACHFPDKERGQKLVGPGLKGIDKERSLDWLVAMITKPDSMLKNDKDAKELLKQYGTAMPNQNVKPDEAKAIIEYIKKLSGG